MTTLCSLMAALVLVPAPKEVVEKGGYCVARDLRIVEKTDAALPKEGYRLSVGTNGVEIAASGRAGARHARETLRQLTATDANGVKTVPCVEITDAPAYPWRGLMLDDCRHFFGKETVRRMLDLMAQHKFNVFHWHLTDDQGWRIEVPGMPELVQCGSVRPEAQLHGTYEAKGTGKPYGGHYTRADLEEIVAYADSLGITVVPEIDFPGHFRAALAAYPQYGCEAERLAKDRNPRRFCGIDDDVLCVGNDEAIRFVEKVLDYVCEIFPSEVIHIGGDECRRTRWKTCPKCQARIRAEGLKDEKDLQGWLTRHFTAYLAKKGRRALGWDEILASGVPKETLVMSWRGPKGGRQAAALGNDVVMTPSESCYLDYKQGLPDDPYQYMDWGDPELTLRQAYDFDPVSGMDADAARHVRGGQGNCWAEFTWNLYDLEWKTWPRACATAEALWCGADKPGWDDFLRRMATHRARLAAAGVNAAPLPPPKAERLPVSTLPENVFVSFGNPDFDEPDGKTMKDLVKMLGDKSTYNVATLTLRCTNDLSTAAVQERVRELVPLFHENGMQVMMDVDPRIARHEFLRRWPDDAQQYLEIAFTNELAIADFGDHMTGGTVKYYVKGHKVAATRKFADGRTAYAHLFTLHSADVFSPHLIPFTRELMARYRALGVDGAMKDEWGFPPAGRASFKEHRGYWYSRHFADAYRRKTGRELLDDCFAMAEATVGNADAKRTIDDYMDLVYARNAAIECDHYAANKEIFGKDTYVTKHSTWYPTIDYMEFMHDGLDWWAAKRDWAQSDEMTPVPAVCGMAKKCGGANWMNEGYQNDPRKYAPMVWRYALCGGRMVYHGVYPQPKGWIGMSFHRRKIRSQEAILDAGAGAAQRAVRLVNRISDAPIDSPVCFVFNRRRLVNWADAAYRDWGEKQVYGLWGEGWATDLYPDDEFANGTFRVDADGYLCVGRQRYLAVVLHHVNALGLAAPKTRVFTSEEMPEVGKYLASVGAVRQTPIGGAESYLDGWSHRYPMPDGTLTLTDGTVVRIKAMLDPTGDSIDGEMTLNGVTVRYAAKGLFAVRVSKEGRVEAVAGAGLTRLVAPGFCIDRATGEDYVWRLK